MSSLHYHVGKDKEAMEEDYQKALQLIFAYGYGCCVLKHNICRDKLEVSDGMPDSFDSLPSEFFANSRCPPALAATNVMEAEVDQSKATKELEKSAYVGN